MAGARLGFGIGNEKLIADLHTIRYSTNPYNVNRMTEAAGAAALDEDGYYMDNCKIIMKNRATTARGLRELGFEVIDSMANFLFARSSRIGGEELYLKLKQKGILVRHFRGGRTEDWLRITIGTEAEMQQLVDACRDLVTSGKE